MVFKGSAKPAFGGRQMVKIKPLKGLVYNKKKINDLSKVITPPNDVISEEEKIKLKDKSPYNFVNLILPDKDGDKYENAAKLLDSWQEENILVSDKEENIYIYSESYCIKEKKFGRTGFISLIRIEDLGKGVLPHEKILEKDLKDRISLMTATKSNLEIPFLLYDDREKVIDAIIKNEISGKEPNIDFIDDLGVNHMLWKISNMEFIERLKKEMLPYQCIIADGHHRYTSALKVRDTLNIQGAEYALMCFVNSFNEGMVILPTNRIVFGLEDINMNSFLDSLNRYFEVKEAGNVHELAKRLESTEIMIDKNINMKNHIFGVYSNINKKSYLLKVKDRSILDSILPYNTDIYKKLDVNILHKIIIEKILGISEEKQKNRENIGFVKGNEEAIKRMEDEDVQFAFFVNPPLMREVFLTARSNETMPQKSTYFYPKVFSGLVVYKIG